MPSRFSFSEIIDSVYEVNDALELLKHTLI